MHRTIFLFLFLIFVNVACENQFAHKKNDWQFVTQTDYGNPKKLYIDQNRIDREDNIVRAWTKMVFKEMEPIKFHSKAGEATLLVKRMDSSVHYNCKSKTSKLISYQLYDEKDQFIHNQWLNHPEEEYIQAGTIDEDMFEFLCKSSRN